MLNDGRGLYLSVSPTGPSSWLFRYERLGKRHDMGLGALHTISRATAREQARIAREQLVNGLDPLTEKRRGIIAKAIARPGTKTFVDCAEQLIASREAGWKSDKHRQDWESSLERFAYPVIGKMPVSDIMTEHVLRVLEPTWTQKTETMMRVRGRIKLVLDFAIAKKFRTTPNPAVWKANLDPVVDRNARKDTVPHPALDYRENPQLVAELRSDQRIAAQALLFNIYTVLRSSDEIRQLQWAQFDRNAQSLDCPAEI